MYQECENLSCYYNLDGLCDNDDILNSITGQCIYLDSYLKTTSEDSVLLQRICSLASQEAVSQTVVRQI